MKERQVSREKAEMRYRRKYEALPMTAEALSNECGEISGR